MVCRFCSQWNPASAPRCAFCRNQMDGDSDLTRTGKTALGPHQVDRVVHIAETMKPPRYVKKHPVEEAIRHWFEVLGSYGPLPSAAIVVGVFLLIVLARRC